VDGGIEVTASHNPMDYNGMKLVRKGARPISGDTGLRDVQRLAEANDFPPVNDAKRGSYKKSICKKSTSTTCWATSTWRTSSR
jgi:phosphomannomutase